MHAMQREDGSWLMDGMLLVDGFREIFKIGMLPGEERGYYQTPGGFVMMNLQRTPTTGDRFRWNDLPASRWSIWTDSPAKSWGS